MTFEEMQLRRIAVCASGVVYWAGVLVHAHRVRKQIGRSPNVRPRGRRERVLWFGWFLVILVWIGQPWLVELNVTMPGLNLLTSLVHPAGLVAGLVMLTLGYAGTLWTYSVLGNNWRMGINPNEKTALVFDGPFHWVRHPIYLLQIVMLTGTALLLPTPVSFLTLALHYLCVRLKAADEEKFLTRVHGAAYSDYSLRTGSLFPRLIGARTRRTAKGHQAVES